jgi:hypothetical protein
MDQQLSGESSEQGAEEVKKESAPVPRAKGVNQSDDSTNEQQPSKNLGRWQM